MRAGEAKETKTDGLISEGAANAEALDLRRINATQATSGSAIEA